MSTCSLLVKSYLYRILLKSGRIPEAALFARTYLPSEISGAVDLWRNDLKSVSEKLAETLADPATYPNLFPDHQWSLKVEQIFKDNRSKIVKACAYPAV